MQNALSQSQRSALPLGQLQPTAKLSSVAVTPLQRLRSSPAAARPARAVFSVRAQAASAGGFGSYGPQGGASQLIAALVRRGGEVQWVEAPTINVALALQAMPASRSWAAEAVVATPSTA